MLDEAAVWKRSLTANEVTEIWQRGQAGLTLTADPAIIGKAFINVEPSDPAGGQTYGTGLYDLNETVSVGAMEGLGYVYNGWAAPFTSQLQTFNHIVTGSTVITANLARNPSDDDHDGLTAWQELVVYLTDPAVADSDADGISDGDEVNGSRTNPLDSQAGAIQYILDNLCTGGVQPGDVVLATGPGNTLRIRLKASATTDFSAWSPLLPSEPGLTGAQSGGVFRLTVPATSAPKRFLRMAGSAP